MIHPIARPTKVIENCMRRSQRIKADRMRHVPLFAGICAKHQCRAPICRWFLCQIDPCRHLVRHRVDPFQIGFVGKAGILQLRVARLWFLERGHACKKASVHLGQDNMHGKVCGRQAALGSGPHVAGCGG